MLEFKARTASTVPVPADSAHATFFADENLKPCLKLQDGSIISFTGLSYDGLTSTSTITGGNGTKTFTTSLASTNTAFALGQRVRWASTVTPTTFVEGTVTSFSGTSMQVLVDTISGTVTSINSWVCSVSGGTGSTGLGYAGLTSATSQTPSVASKTFTTNLTSTQTAFAVGQRVRAASAANPTTNFMEGVITAFSGTTLTLSADFVGATPIAATDWQFSTAGSVAVAGASSVAVPFTDQTNIQYVTISDANITASVIPKMNGVLLNTTEIADPLFMYDVTLVSVTSGSAVARITVFDMNGNLVENLTLPAITLLYSF